MSFFERLKTKAAAEWRAYTEHPFTAGLADGTLPETAFRHYLVQDYLFLFAIQNFAPTEYEPAAIDPDLRCVQFNQVS